MRELLSSYGKRFFKWLAACAVLVVLSLAAAGEAALIGAFFIGCLAAAVCAWILVYRTWKSSGLELREAKQQMLVGMVLRLFTMFIVFWTAIQISVPVFVQRWLGKAYAEALQNPRSWLENFVLECEN